jgi:hypothetical protein
VSKRSALVNGPFAAGNSLQQLHSELQTLEAFNIDQVSGRQAVLRDQYWLLVPAKIVQQVRGFPF